MRRKFCVAVLALVLVLSVAVGFVACNPTDDPTGDTPTTPEHLDYLDFDGKTLMVTIGDSIAEGIVGPSPLSEKDNYIYSQLLGKGNGFTHINKSVSGWKTTQLLDYLTIKCDKDDEAAFTTELLQRADIIQLSILGNDLLQDNLGKLLVMTCTYLEETEDGIDSSALDYVNDILFNDEFKYDGYTDADEALGRVKGDPNPRNSTANFRAIVNRLAELNPNATLLIQTVYNPIFDTSTLVLEQPITYVDTNGATQYWRGDTRTVRQILLEDHGIAPAQYREIGDYLIELMNNIVRDYHEENPDLFEIVEVHDEMMAYYNADTSNGKAYTRRLYSQDYIHPSNEGHAMIADITQDVLVELGLASGDYLAFIKAHRCEQLDRLFDYANTPVDVEAAKAAINAATTSRGVNLAYFNAITRPEFFDDVANRDPSKAYPIFTFVVPNYADNM
jgi:lysophospholipase L1-like esterase